MMTTPIAASAGTMAAFLASWGVAQIPTETPLGEWSKLSVSAACLLIAAYLITKTIPMILDTNAKANEALRATMEKGFADLRAQIAHGDEQVTTLLHHTLTQALENKRS